MSGVLASNLLQNVGGRDLSTKIIYSTCNKNTVIDGRGGIFTWLPDEPVLEFSLVHITKGKKRGFHSHPEFKEYFLCVEGEALLLWKNFGSADVHQIHLLAGFLRFRWLRCFNQCQVFS